MFNYIDIACVCMFKGLTETETKFYHKCVLPDTRDCNIFYTVLKYYFISGYRNKSTCLNLTLSGFQVVCISL